jgi:uncharacterized protein (TIGR02001 family)
MKTSLLAGMFGVLALASIAPLAHAEDEAGPFSAGVTLTSDYRFRGQSQTGREAAIQGYVQAEFAGFFANVWASNIDFNDEALGVTSDDSSIEIDFTLGYNYEISEKTAVGIKAVYYYYPDADYLPAVATEYDYFEALASIEHDFGVAGVSGEFAWSPDYFNETGTAYSVKGGVSVPIVDEFLFMGALSASANVGYQWINSNDLVGELYGRFGTPDYLYYDFGASAEWEIFTFDVRWVDTDIDEVDCFNDGTSGTDLCEGGVVLTVSADFAG